jgi:hypothetical protein
VGGDARVHGSFDFRREEQSAHPKRHKKFIVARKLSPVREHISIQQSRTRGIIEPLSNLPECEPRGIY